MICNRCKVDFIYHEDDDFGYMKFDFIGWHSIDVSNGYLCPDCVDVFMQYIGEPTLNDVMHCPSKIYRMDNDDDVTMRIGENYKPYNERELMEAVMKFSESRKRHNVFNNVDYLELAGLRD